MTGWPLVIALLVLGGLLSTLGDRLGSRVGKARLSIFKLRPRSTAVFITVLTGSLISALSLGLMLMVSRELRVGLFELDDLQTKLQESRLALLPLQKERKLLEERIINGEQELKQLEKNLIALRRGDVVISSGETLASSTFDRESSTQIKQEIENLLQVANLYSYLKIRPGEKPNRRILLVRRDHVKRLEEVIDKKGSWVVNIRSAGNVLRGENYIYAFPEVINNRQIVLKDEIISSIEIDFKDPKKEDINKQIKILLSSTLAEIKRRGSLSSDLKISPGQINKITNKLIERKHASVKLITVSLDNRYTLDTVSVRVELVNNNIK